MRAAPGPIPSKLPQVSRVATMVQRSVVERPDIRLCDRSIGQLWEDLSDGTPVWLTGSNVWIPAVFGLTLRDPSDYDLVFSSPQSCDAFVKAVVTELNRLIPGGSKYTLGQSAFGSHRVLHPSGVGVIDAWSLGDHDSIGEMLMTYPHAYQRAAYYLSRSPSPGCVFRIVRDPTPEQARKKGLFDSITQSRAGYPGREQPPQVSSQAAFVPPPPGVIDGLLPPVQPLNQPPGIAVSTLLNKIIGS